MRTGVSRRMNRTPRAPLRFFTARMCDSSAWQRVENLRPRDPRVLATSPNEGVEDDHERSLRDGLQVGWVHERVGRCDDGIEVRADEGRDLLGGLGRRPAPLSVLRAGVSVRALDQSDVRRHGPLPVEALRFLAGEGGQDSTVSGCRP